MHTPRWYPTVVALPDGRQVVMGGQVKKGVMATLSEVYNPANNTWTELSGLAEAKTLGTYPRAILAPNGKIFMIKNGSGKSAFMDVDTQTWTTVGKPPPAPGGGGMAMYDNGKILIFAVELERARLLRHRPQRREAGVAQGGLAALPRARSSAP